MSVCIVVLGGHRCGTSAVAGVLYHLSVFMGYRLLGAGRYNVRGHWEDRTFLEHHKKIVGGVLRWKKPRVNFEPCRQAYGQLVRRREAEHKLWGFKDPRTIFVFPHFLEVAKCEVRVINIWRDLEASAHSMWKRRGKKATSHVNVDLDEAREIAKRYRRKHMQVLKAWEGERLDLRYGRLCRIPGREVNRVAAFVGVPPKGKAVRFIDPKLRHF